MAMEFTVLRMRDLWVVMIMISMEDLFYELPVAFFGFQLLSRTGI